MDALKLLRPQIERWAAGFERAGARTVVDAEDLMSVGEFAAWRLLEAAGPADAEAPSRALLRARSAMRDQLRLVDSLSRGMRKAAIAGEIEVPRLLSISDQAVRGRHLQVRDPFGADPAELAAIADLWRWVRRVVGPRCSRILELRFRDGRTQAEAAEQTGFGKTTARLLEERGLRTLSRLRAGFGEEE